MPSRGFRVGRSRTGLGLFAVRPIAKKQYVVTYSGKWITTEEARRRERLGDPKYLFEVNSTMDDRRFDPAQSGPLCEPFVQAEYRAGVAKRQDGAGGNATDRTGG
jgi:hypothetical protein